MKRFSRIVIILIGLFVIAGYAMPTQYHLDNPVKGARVSNYDFGGKRAGWYPLHPKGMHAHLGTDIFARKGTEVTAPCWLWILHTKQQTANTGLGGNYVWGVGSGFRIYYMAHLSTVEVHRFQFLKKGDKVGTVGNTGSTAQKTPAHLHFSILSPLPAFSGWKAVNQHEGLEYEPLNFLEKTFFVCPADVIVGQGTGT